MRSSRAEGNSARPSKVVKKRRARSKNKGGAELSKSRGKGCSVVTLSHNKMYLEGN